MNTSKKIIIVIIPIAILGILFTGSFLFGSSVTFQSENQTDENSKVESFDISYFSSPVVGSSDASVTIIAFNDYQCLSCKNWFENEYFEIFENLIEPKKANIVFIDSIPAGFDSILISQATFCAEEQGKYFEYQKHLFSSQQEIDTWGKSEQLKKFANVLNMDGEKFENCLDSEKYKNTILENIQYTTNMGVDKIPVFKIVNQKGNEHILKGGLSSDIFETTIMRLQ